LPVSSVGSFDGQFTTVNDVLGSYQVEVEIDGQVFTEWVPIAAYRKPEFEVTVTPVKPVYYVGEDVQFKVKAEFFTGEPVVGAALDAWATRSEIWDWSPFEEEEYEWWAYGEEYSYGGELVAELAGTTDENGEAVFTVRARGDGSSSADYQFRLSVTGADVSGRGFTGEGSVKVAQGAVDLDVAFEDYVVAPGSTVGVRLRGTLADGGAPAAGRRVTVEFGENVWTRDRVRDHRRGAHSVVLDERGEASLTLRPQNDGEFYARAVTKDDAGRTVRASDAIWVFSGAGSLPGPSHSLQIVLDKKRYAVGETATAVVRTDKPGGSALVTVEAEGVLWSKVVALEGEATTVPIPVTDAVRPNASVRACYIREKSFAQSGRSLIVDMGRDVLSVEVTPNVSETLPGGAVSYTLTTRDADGDPVSADVSLSVVDEGVYAVREDTTDPLRSFFPNRWSQVGTYYSFPEVYLDGDDKSGMDVDVRTEFKDTAFWAPSVQTGDDGTATVGLVLPDNLTSWRATAVAVSDDARAGKGTANVLARKPVMVRASLPAFMVQDERQTIGVTVRNETDQDQRIEVSFMAHGLQVAGDASRRLDLKARSSGRAQWEVTALGPGEARVRVTAVASRGGHSDGLEQTFPLLTNGPTTQSFAAGDTDSSARFQMRLSPGAVSGELQISLAPTVLSGLVGSLDELVDYPYGCVEQTMSRFMPAVVVRQFLHELRIDRPDLDAKIVEVSKQSQARLASMQGSEGGFGWFLYDEGEPGMTALVLEGLYHAKQAGVDVEPHMRDRAIEWAKRYAAERPVLQRNAADDARLAYALSLHGVASNAWRRLLPDLRAVREDPRALAYVVLALAASKEGQTEQDAALRQSAYKALVELATVSETAASWEDGYWYEPTAVALLAVVKTDPDSPLAAKAMRYLMQKRRGRTWTSTRDTAQIIVAAISHLRGTKELEPAFEATVSVNGTASQTFAFDAQDLSRHELVRVPVARLKEGDNEVTVTFRGVGRVYWSAQLTQEVHDPRPRPTTSGDGLTVKREYFRMRGERLEDGTIRLVPSRSPVTSARQGEVLRCRITLTSDRERSYVLVRDPALSNARAIEPGDLQEWEWYYWWSDQSFFDDHTALFIDSLPKGEHVVEYSVRAEALGTGIALPATASLMYQPDVRATTGTYRLEVRP
jgi:uncharacterized protein YfaS (alpha-2-macroglobulin family)